MKFSLSLAPALLLACTLSLSAMAQTAATTGRSDSAIVAAAQQGQVATVERLLSGGVDPDARYAQGYTALMWAAEKGQYATVQSLLKHNASKDLRNDAGLTAFDLAVRQNQGDVIALLRDAS